MRATCCVSPGSRLDEYEELIGLPLGNPVRGLSSSSPEELMTSPEAITSAALDRRQGFFFLAEITMRRMLNRSKETRRRNPPTKERRLAVPHHKCMKLVNRAFSLRVRSSNCRVLGR